MSVFKKYSYWVNSGKYTAIQKFSVLAMGIVSFMLLARMLGPSGFGVWGLFIVISSITETARTALIRNAFIRFMNQTEEAEHDRLQAAAFVLSLSISIVLATLFLLLAYPIGQWLKGPELAVMLMWYSVTLIISVVFAHCEMLLNAKMDFKGVCWMYCVRQGLLALAILICYLLKFPVSPVSLSLFSLGPFIPGSLTGLYFSRPYLKMSFDGYRPWIGKLWHFGKYVFGNNISSLLFRSTDNFITSNYFGTAVSAYY